MNHKLPSTNWKTDMGRRRSMRVILGVPLFVSGLDCEGSKFKVEARTVVFNAHGALIVSAVELQKGQMIEITHKLTRESRGCRVVHASSPQAGKFESGIEFLQPSASFWRIAFPPEDWVVPES